MNLTFEECVQERKADSNPTHYTTFDKSTEISKKILILFKIPRIFCIFQAPLGPGRAAGRVAGRKSRGDGGWRGVERGGSVAT